jgi:hypothetical protein
MTAAFTLAALTSCGSAGGTGAALPDAPPPRTVPASAEPTVIGNPADCPVSELEPIIKREILMAEGIKAEVQTLACLNGYAQVLLVAPDRPEVEPLPIFLRHATGEWQIVDYGGHIDCTYPEGIPQRTVEACQALGLS